MNKLRIFLYLYHNVYTQSHILVILLTHLFHLIISTSVVTDHVPMNISHYKAYYNTPERYIYNKKLASSHPRFLKLHARTNHRTVYYIDTDAYYNASARYIVVCTPTHAQCINRFLSLDRYAILASSCKYTQRSYIYSLGFFSRITAAAAATAFLFLFTLLHTAHTRAGQSVGRSVADPEPDCETSSRFEREYCIVYISYCVYICCIAETRSIVYVWLYSRYIIMLLHTWRDYIVYYIYTCYPCRVCKDMYIGNSFVSTCSSYNTFSDDCLFIGGKLDAARAYSGCVQLLRNRRQNV